MATTDHKTELGALKAALEWRKLPTRDGVDRWEVEGRRILRGRRRGGPLTVIDVDGSVSKAVNLVSAFRMIAEAIHN